MIWYDMIWQNWLWCYTVWYGMIRYVFKNVSILRCSLSDFSYSYLFLRLFISLLCNPSLRFSSMLWSTITFHLCILHMLSIANCLDNLILNTLFSPSCPPPLPPPHLFSTCLPSLPTSFSLPLSISLSFSVSLLFSLSHSLSIDLSIFLSYS